MTKRGLRITKKMIRLGTSLSLGKVSIANSSTSLPPHRHLHSLTFLPLLLLQQPHWEEEFPKIVLRGRSLGFESEPKLASDSMESEKEFPELKRNLYPDIEPDSSGFLKVSDIHTMGAVWKSRRPFFFMGGPGGGTSPSNRRFFDPEFYRIILFDQRGAGKSTPHACLVENTTCDLISDIEKLREHLEIPEWQVKRFLVGHGGVHLPLHIANHTLTRLLELFLEGFFF